MGHLMRQLMGINGETFLVLGIMLSGKSLTNVINRG